MAVTVPAATEQIDYADLYARWERGNWCATEIDFSQDRIDWHERIPAEERFQRMYGLSSFFIGEQRVASELGPMMRAAPEEDMRIFLCTQIADEARHVAFGARFLRDMTERDERYREAIQRTLVECGPAADGVLTPPWMKDAGDDAKVFGYSIAETRAFAMKALDRRLKVIGLTPGA